MQADTEFLETVELFKINIGITHCAKDEYFVSVILADKAELEGQGVELDLSVVEDKILLADYSAWNYRKRNDDIPLSANLKQRIQRRRTRRRAND